MSSSEAQMLYRKKWDDIHYEDGGVIEGADKQVAVVMSTVDVQEKA